MTDHKEAFPGLDPQGSVHWQLSPAELVEASVRNEEGELTDDGPFNAITAPHTGRSPNDRFVVREPKSEEHVWWGNVNVPVTQETYEALKGQILDYLNGQPNLYVRDVFAGADEAHRLSVRAINHTAWHNLFIYNMFLRPTREQLQDFSPEFTILHAPNMKVENWEELGFNSPTAVVINIGEGVVLVAGTRYAGEMKKSIFGVMNYILPQKGVLSMHCSANIGAEGDTALFFGLSGTGKTTLSADSSRGLIGDDEHGWDEDGIFNFEGGCYAKVIRLSEEAEPEIYGTTRRFGTILENVMVDENRSLDLDDDSITENTRASYPLHYISNYVPSGQGNHPTHIFFLTADAFGVMPPIARLTREQAMYYFLSGYTAKVAGTERGVTEPRATFSACFGSPFLTLRPSVYAGLLGEKLDHHTDTKVWLINTGWTGGPYGVGHRMPIRYTRAMLHAALDGELDGVDTETDPVFGLQIPSHVPNVPSEVLHPRQTWEDQDAYDTQARRLARMFRENFERFEGRVSEAVKASGPTG